MQSGELLTMPFYGTCGAGARVTLVSRKLPFPFISQVLSVHFALNTAGTLQVSFYVSPDAEAPTAGPPSGLNLLAVFGEVGYLAGDDDRITVQMQWHTREAGEYIKVHAINSDVFDHTINACATVMRA